MSYSATGSVDLNNVGNILYLSNNITTLSSNLTINGGLHANEQFYFQGNANISGNLLIQNSVGINTSSPVSNLDVVGNARISSNLLVNSGTMWVDATNNRVGILNTNPQYALDVKGDANITSTLIVSGSTTMAGLTTGGSLTFVNSTSGLSVTNGSLLGNGNDLTQVRRNLNVYNVARIGYADSTDVGSGTSNNSILDVSGNIYGASNITVMANANIAGNLRVGSNVQILGNLQVGSSSIYLLGDQNKLGIGKIPTYDLDVIGNINLTGSLYQSGNSYASSQWTTSGSNIYYNSGNVGIGTSNPQYKIDVTGDANISGNITSTNYIGLVRKYWSNNYFSGFSQALSTITYHKIATIGATSDTNNIGVITIEGSIGGALQDRICYLNASFGTRTSETFSGFLYGRPTSISNITTYADIVIYKNASNTYDIYLQLFNYYKFDLMIGGYGGTVSINECTSSGATTTTPSGTYIGSFISSVKYFNLNGNFGINNSNPQYALDVTGSANISSNAIFNANANVYGNLGITGNIIGTSNIILLNGNLGIGTSNPQQLLTISADNSPFLRFDRSGSARYDFEIGMNGSADLIFRGGANAVGSSLNEFFRISDQGNIGIGTKNPIYILDVAGSANISSNAIFNANANVSGNLGVTGNIIGTSNIILLNGNLGINTSFPRHKLDLSGNANIFGNLLTSANANISGNIGVTGNIIGTSNIILLNGNIGIGTSNPLQKIDIAGNANISGNLFVKNNMAINSTSAGANLDVQGNARITGNLNVDNGALWVDATNNRVGILNTNPQYALDVIGDANIVGALNTTKAIQINSTGSGTTTLWQTNNSQQYLARNVTYTNQGMTAVCSSDGGTNDYFDFRFYGSSLTSNRSATFRTYHSDPLYTTNNGNIDIGLGVFSLSASQSTYDTTSINGLGTSGTFRPKFSFQGATRSWGFGTTTDQSIMIVNCINDSASNFMVRSGSGIQVTNSSNYTLVNRSFTEALRVNGNSLFNGNLNLNTGNLLITDGNANIAGNLRVGSNVQILGNLQVGSSSIYLLGDQNKLGIGKIPVYDLDIVGNINLTGSLYQSGNSYSSTQWTTSGSNIYYISGNVGIGTSNPQYALDVKGSSNINGTLYLSSLNMTTTSTQSAAITTFASSSVYGIVSEATSSSSQRTHIGFRVPTIGELGNIYTDSSLLFGIYGKSQIYLNTPTLNTNANLSITGNLDVDTGTFCVDATNNRVGILNTNPQYALDIKGTANITGALYTYGDIYNGDYISFGNVGNTNVDFSTGYRDINSTAYSGGSLLRTSDLTIYQYGIGSYDSTVNGLTGYTGFDPVIKFRPSNPTGGLGYQTEFGFPYILSGSTYTTYPQIFCIGQNNGGTDPDINSTFHATKGLQLTNASYYANWTDSMTTMTNEALRVNGDTYIPVGQLRLNAGNIFISNGSLAVGASTTGANLDIQGNACITGNLNVDNGAFWVDATNNRVGILNTNPQYTLDVKGSANISSNLKTSYITPNYDSGWFSVATSTSYSRSLGFTIDITQPPNFKVLFSTTSAGTIGDGTGTTNVVCDITSQGVNAGFAQSYALRYSSSTSVILRTGSSAVALYYNGSTTVTATTGYYRLFAY